ncbi:shikimate kinase [Chlamydia pecorum]|nr:shikimate kinase [Chlamydia pecorum]AGW38173.1 shikimate kinase [Chlamydia pecorum PV3056/3]
MKIFLCGLPTSGKSLLGKAFADFLSYTFFDLDDLIIKNYGEGIHTTTAKMFLAYGNATFCHWEAQILHSIPDYNSVVALGGGTLMHNETYQEIRNKGPLVFLSLPLPIVKQRLQTRGLPEKLKEEQAQSSLEEALKKRIEHMKTLATHTFLMDTVILSDPHSLTDACAALRTLLNL